MPGKKIRFAVFFSNGLSENIPISISGTDIQGFWSGGGSFADPSSASTSFMSATPGNFTLTWSAGDLRRLILFIC
jgi:hypothetical protein